MAKVKKQFHRLNQRRNELIEKKYGEGLTDEEERELARLQKQADRCLPAPKIDPVRLKQLREKYAEITGEK